MEAGEGEGSFSRWSCLQRGRELYLPPTEDEIGARTWYQRDIDQIIYSTVFRKMQRKSQLLPALDPRRRTRLVHTLEVTRIAREIGSRLGVDPVLTEAIALGHDLANSAYGRVGNDVLRELTPNQPFRHEEAGALMVQTLAARRIEAEDGENSIGKARSILDQPGDTARACWRWAATPFEIGIGALGGSYYDYPVTPEVLDGIMKHSRGEPETLEGQVVQVADEFAYVSQDLDDLIIAGFIDAPELESHQYREIAVDAITRTWDQIDAHCSSVSAKRLLSRRSGVRIAVLVERFVQYNLQRLHCGESAPSRPSRFVGDRIPILEVDPGLRFVIDFIWRRVIEPQYARLHIATANELAQCEIRQLFRLLRERVDDRPSLTRDNGSVVEFMRSLAGSRFQNYDDNWRACYLIAHLSWDEIREILARYLKRDYTFIIDVGGDAVYPR